MLLLFVEQENGLTLLGNNPIFGLDSEQREGTRFVGPLTAIWYLIFIIPFFIFVPEAKLATDSKLNIIRALKDLASNIINLKNRELD